MTQEEIPISRHELNDLIFNGADIALSHKCSDYYEFLRMHSVCINGSDINIFTSYPSASALYNINGDNYFVYHSHSLNNTLMLARTKFVANDGKFGGPLGLPNCNIFHNWSHSDQKWVLFDAWEPCKLPVFNIIKNCDPIKLRINVDGMTIIADTDFAISFDGGGYSIRTAQVSVQNGSGFNLISLEIHNDILNQRIWKITETPPKYSRGWLQEKAGDVLGRPRWPVKNISTRRFSFEILSRKLLSEKYYFVDYSR